jgi:hypothetical protein
MAHAPEKRLELRAAYIGGLPLEQAAHKIDIPYATARNWFNAAKKSGDDWDRFRRTSLIVAGGEIEQAMGRIAAAGLMQCEALLERVGEIGDPAEATETIASLADALSKMRLAAKSFMPETSTAAMGADALAALAAWCGEHAPARGIVLADALEGFARVKKWPIAAALEELRARARAAGAVETSKIQGLSDDSAKQILQKFLGGA